MCDGLKLDMSVSPPSERVMRVKGDEVNEEDEGDDGFCS